MKREKFLIFFIIFAIFFVLNASSETVTILAEDDWAPWAQSDGTGIGNDVIKSAYAAVGIDVKYEVMLYDRALARVEEGSGIACFNVPMQSDNEQTFLWPDQKLYTVRSLFYAKSDYQGSVNSTSDLEGKKLGLTQGYGYGNAIEQNDKIVKEYSRTDEVITKKLLAGRVDFIILYERCSDLIFRNLNAVEKVKSVGVSESADIYLAFSKSNADAKRYMEQFNRGFEIIKNNGVYDSIMKKWEK